MPSRSTTIAPVRYAVIGAGWIAQSAFMPGVTRTNNSVITGLISGDKGKAELLAQRYGIRHVYGYDQFEKFLQDKVADAVYIATPNGLHRRHAEPALAAGYHALIEKPLTTSVEDCEALESAAAASGAKLMVAYRLHFEAATLEAVKLVREGALGELRGFFSVLSMRTAEANHRTAGGFWTGPVADLGTYPLNAVRNLFESEPEWVSALGTSGADMVTPDTVAVTLRFPGDRVAQFTVSYTAEPTNGYTIIGSHGSLEVRPGYSFGIDRPLALTVMRNGERSHTLYPPQDQFACQTQYFSQCILEGREPEADGDDGRLDVRVMAAIERSLRAGGQAELLPPMTRRRRINLSQGVFIPAEPPPELLNVSAPGK